METILYTRRNFIQDGFKYVHINILIENNEEDFYKYGNTDVAYYFTIKCDLDASEEEIQEEIKENIQLYYDYKINRIVDVTR